MDELGEALRTVLAAVDPVPDAARRAAHDAWEWRDVDAALAALTSDSLTEPVGATTRGTPPRLLTFESGAITIDLEVTADADRVHVLGQITPGRATDVTAMWPGGAKTVASDERGRFTMGDLPVEWLRLSVAGDEPARTEWFRA